VRRWVGLVAIISLMPAVAACTGSVDTPPTAASAASGVPTTTSDMAAVWSAVELTSSMPYRATNQVDMVDSAGKAYPQTFEVDVDGPARRFRIGGLESGDGVDGFVVGDTYLQRDLTPGKWLRMDLRRLGPESYWKQYIDTQTTIWQLIGMVRAVPAPGGMTCDVDLRLALADPRNAARAEGLKRQIKFNASDHRTVNLRFDTQGRIAEMSYSEDITDAAGKDPLHISEDITFSRLSYPIDLHLPADDDIRDATRADYDKANKPLT
jgi:hypothetical protein